MTEAKKLSQIRDSRELAAPSYFEGRCMHCPLHTANRTASRFENIATVVIGVAECAYYTQQKQGHSRHSGINLHYGIVLDWQDITFGYSAKVESALLELQTKHPPGILLITSCVAEIVGEDLDSVAARIFAQSGIPVGVAHTEHFKTHITAAGTAAVMTACAAFMQPQAKQSGINLLGMSADDFQESELSDFLPGNEIHLFFPDSSMDALKAAPSARMNLVTDESCLELAQTMEKTFGTPYIILEKHIIPERMLENYHVALAALGIPCPPALAQKADACRQAADALSCMVRNTTYLYQQTAFPAPECNAFLTQLGMIPLAICHRTVPDLNDADWQKVLSSADPYAVSHLGIPQQLMQNLAPQIVFNEHGGHNDTGSIGFAAIQNFLDHLQSGNSNNDHNGRGTGYRHAHQGYEHQHYRTGHHRTKENRI